jgi:triosephosphate isomerase
MAESLKKLFVGGNWKSNNTLAESKNLVENVLNKLDFDPNRVDVVVAPIFLHIPYVVDALDKKIQVAAQNCSATTLGAYTGEIAPAHIQDVKAHWVIIGHSERRSKYNDTDEVVAKKTRNALDSNMQVILCIGETLEQREANKTLEVIAHQLQAVKGSIKIEEWPHIVVAYEPVWAIGTGKTATPEQAEEVHKFIREHLAKEISAEVSQATRIIYGGSVTDANAEELIKKPNIDGFLVGGAALKPGFAKIVDSCKAKL